MTRIPSSWTRLACLLGATAAVASLAATSAASAGGAGASPAGLVFTRADGSRIAFESRARAWCGSWNTDDRRKSLLVAVVRRDGSGFARPFWLVQTILVPLVRPVSLRFPLSDSPESTVVFVYDRETGNEVSSEQESSRGRLVIGPTRCALGSPVRVSVTGILDSELAKRPIRVSGTFTTTVGPRPAWRPT